MLQTSRWFSANLYVLASSVVGADSHIGPAKRTDFTVVFGKFVTPQQAEWKAKTVKAVISLKKGNKYSFKIRAYKLDEETNVYGAYSKIKKVKM